MSPVHHRSRAVVSLHYLTGCAGFHADIESLFIFAPHALLLMQHLGFHSFSAVFCFPYLHHCHCCDCIVFIPAASLWVTIFLFIPENSLPKPKHLDTKVSNSVLAIKSGERDPSSVPSSSPSSSSTSSTLTNPKEHKSAPVIVPLIKPSAGTWGGQGLVFFVLVRSWFWSSLLTRLNTNKQIKGHRKKKRLKLIK